MLSLYLFGGEINIDFYNASEAIKLPNNSEILTKKIKKELVKVLEKKPGEIKIT